MLVLEDIALQEMHLLHGVVVGDFSQLRALANILATDVFPMPRGPVKI